MAGVVTDVTKEEVARRGTPDEVRRVDLVVEGLGMASSAYPGERVVIGQLLRGYAAAYQRFEEASRLTDPDPGFFALFESLNWAVAVDDVIRDIWTPNGDKLNWEWRSFAGGEELAELMNGIRYARNLVHHHWANALRQEAGFRFPIRFPMVSFSWAWRPAEELPPHPDEDKPYVVRNRAAYEQRLAGVRASDTLLAVHDAFTRVGVFLDPPRAPNRAGESP